MRITPFIRVLILIACLASAAQPPLLAYGAESVKIGVLAFPSKAQALAQWQPLAGVFKQAMPKRNFEVKAFNFSELEQAVAARQLDFVLTNPGHYLLLRNRSGLSSPLATVASDLAGHTTTVYGGVIFTRAGQDNINTLSDIKGKTVTAPDIKCLGAYQMPTYELNRAGVHLPKDVKLIFTGNPQDKTVAAVLAGRAEVGFVRSGVLEGMAREGKLDIKQLKILNRQNLPGFPLQVSTRLYPEWPFAAMPLTDENLARRVASILFLLEDNKEATRAMAIHGFVVPADYSPVEDMLRELRMPPFDTTPSFTLQDIWTLYRWQMTGGLLVGGMFLLLGMGLLYLYRQLAANNTVLLLQQHKLHESEEKFRALVESTSDWIWEVDRNGRYTYVSPKVEALLGYTQAEVMGKSPLDFMPYEEAQRISPVFSKIVAAHAPFVTLENTNLHKEGRRVILETSGIPFFDAKGEFAGYRGIDRDITEQKNLKAEAEKARNLESLGILAGGIAHDFNNLFQGLIGNIELAKMNIEESSEAFQFLEKAEQTYELATKLTSQLITFSPGGNSLPRNIPPAKYIKEEADSALAGSRLVPEFNLADTLWDITVDPTQFRNVIKQLVLNAREAMPSESGGTLKIMAANEPLPEQHGKHPSLAPGNYVRISIEDHGCGISKENLPHIFDPYFSTKQRSTQKGMGLGLALCDTLIRKHNGAITVESELGKGTTFHLYLPAAGGR
mgnify:CR=1 FL=1